MSHMAKAPPEFSASAGPSDWSALSADEIDELAGIFDQYDQKKAPWVEIRYGDNKYDSIVVSIAEALHVAHWQEPNMTPNYVTRYSYPRTPRTGPSRRCAQAIFPEDPRGRGFRGCVGQPCNDYHRPKTTALKKKGSQISGLPNHPLRATERALRTSAFGRA
jgi:hypothetical protein